MKVALHNHKHYQVTLATARVKTWKRICLPYRPTDRKLNAEKEALCVDITYTEAGISCFVRQERGKFKVLFFVGNSELKILACVQLNPVVYN